SDQVRLLVALSAMGIVAAGLRLFPPDTSTFYPACPFHALTGLLCPVCGFTRALAALVAGRWQEAVHANPLVAIGAPVLAVRILGGEGNPRLRFFPHRRTRLYSGVRFFFSCGKKGSGAAPGGGGGGKGGGA